MDDLEGNDAGYDDHDIEDIDEENAVDDSEPESRDEDSKNGDSGEEVLIIKILKDNNILMKCRVNLILNVQMVIL